MREKEKEEIKWRKKLEWRMENSVWEKKAVQNKRNGREWRKKRKERKRRK